MAFSSSSTVTYPGSATTDIPVPYVADSSGNNYSLCLYSHVLLSCNAGGGRTVFTFKPQVVAVPITVAATGVMTAVIPQGTQAINCSTTSTGGGSVTFGKEEK